MFRPFPWTQPPPLASHSRIETIREDEGPRPRLHMTGAAANMHAYAFIWGIHGGRERTRDQEPSSMETRAQHTGMLARWKGRGPQQAAAKGHSMQLSRGCRSARVIRPNTYGSFCKKVLALGSKRRGFQILSRPRSFQPFS
jgi:hypothetical protein